MDSKEEVLQLVSAAKIAQAEFEKYDQKQIDAVVKAIGKAVFDNAETLAVEEAEETKFGDVDDKISKIKIVPMSHWAFMKGKKSVGMLEYDPQKRLAVYAKPIGVIASITPSTGPVATLTGNAMSGLKCRNAIICAPHPAAKKVSAHCCEIMRAELIKLGAPADLIQLTEEPTIEKTNELMKIADTVIATGGPAMVRAAYSSGRPSFGVGPGNVQVIVDKGYEGDIEYLAEATVMNRCRDNGIPCTGEQNVIIQKDDEDRLVKTFAAHGAFVVKDKETVDKIRSLLFCKDKNDNFVTYVPAVGKTALELAAMLKLDVPANTRILMVKAEGNAKTELLFKEKLTSVIVYCTYDSFEDAVDMAVTNLKVMGAGHTSVIYSNDDAHIDKVGEVLPVSRLLVNTTSGFAGGTPNVGLNPTVSLGCGFWGGNSISENLTYEHLMQTTRVARFIPDAAALAPDDVWGE